MASYSALRQPAPMATSRRPPLRMSIEARSWASTAGWRRSLLSTNAPTRSVVVAAAIAVIAGTGESCGMRWSGTTSEVRPDASARLAISVRVGPS